MLEHLRHWEADGFRLDTWDTGRTDHLGKTILHYALYDDEWNQQDDRSQPGTMVFEAEDFACSPMHAIDSDRSLAGILAFLSLRPGDTDAEYFEAYTPWQREWMDARAEELSIACMSTLPED